MATSNYRRQARTRLAALALGSAVVLGLTACGSDSGETSKGSDEAGGTTAPGTELSYGESATIERETVSGGKYTVTITVEEPEKGTAEDLAKISEIEDHEYEPEYTAYFVDFSVTYDEIDDKALADLVNETGIPEGLVLNGVDQEDNWQLGLSKTGAGGSYAFDKCERGKMPDEVKAGTTVEGCRTFVMYPDKEMVAVWFAEDDTPYAQPKADPAGEPVVWK